MHVPQTDSEHEGASPNIAPPRSCSYIKNTFAYAGVRGDGAPMWKSAAGNIYADERSHWDILYYS